MFSQVSVHRGVVVMPGPKSLLGGWVCLVPGPFQGVSPVPGLFWGWVYGWVGVLRVYRGWAQQGGGGYTRGWVGIPWDGWVYQGVGIPGISPGIPPPPVLTSSDGHRGGRYASYWNAFLFYYIFCSSLSNNPKFISINSITVNYIAF